MARNDGCDAGEVSGISTMVVTEGTSLPVLYPTPTPHGSAFAMPRRVGCCTPGASGVASEARRIAALTGGRHVAAAQAAPRTGACRLPRAPRHVRVGTVRRLDPARHRPR